MICQSGLRFFGPTHSIKENSLEYLYILVKHLGISYYAAYNMPLWRRKWFIDKLISENKRENEKREMQTQSVRQKTSSNSSKRLFGN